MKSTYIELYTNAQHWEWYTFYISSTVYCLPLFIWGKWSYGRVKALHVVSIVTLVTQQGVLCVFLGVTYTTMAVVTLPTWRLVIAVRTFWSLLLPFIILQLHAWCFRWLYFKYLLQKFYFTFFNWIESVATLAKQNTNSLSDKT